MQKTEKQLSGKESPGERPETESPSVTSGIEAGNHKHRLENHLTGIPLGSRPIGEYESLQDNIRRLLKKLAGGIRKEHPGKSPPRSAAEAPHLFSSMESMHKTTRWTLGRFLGKFRKEQSRVSRGNRRRNTVVTTASGREFRTVRYSSGETSLAPLQTVISAMHNNKYDLGRRRFDISCDDLIGWKKVEHESLTLILVVDVSKSTFPYISVFAEIVKSLAKYFNRNSDRIGLISLQALQAKILNNPTNNYRVITKSMTELKIHGQTPLADGLLKALSMARLERLRKPGSKNLVILISDCYPEPLTGRFSDLFDEPSYLNALSSAALYKKSNVYLLVINPCLEHRSEGEMLPGERLSQSLADASGGKLIKLFRPESCGADGKIPPPGKKDIEMVLRGIEETFDEIDFGITGKSRGTGT